MRMIIIFENFKYDETLNETNKYFLFSLGNMNVMFLKNLEYPYANRLLDLHENSLITENSFLNKIGFVEILYILGLSVSVKINKTNHIELDFELDNLEVNLCSDSLKSFRIFLTNLLNEAKLIKKLFKLERRGSDLIVNEVINLKNQSIYIEVDSNNEIDSIIKSGYFTQKYNKTEVFSDEIDFDCEENIIKEEENSKKQQKKDYSIKINYIKINLFDGRDFCFIENLSNNSSEINQMNRNTNELNKSNIKVPDMNFEIINDYITSKKSLKIVDEDSRKRSVKRNYENQINIIIKETNLKININK